VIFYYGYLPGLLNPHLPLRFFMVIFSGLHMGDEYLEIEDQILNKDLIN